MAQPPLRPPVAADDEWEDVSPAHGAADDEWEDVAPSNDAGTAAGGLGVLSGLTAVARPVLAEVAESQGLANVIEKVAGAGKLVPGLGTGAATAGSLAYGIAKGEDPTKLGVRAVTGAATGYGMKLLKEGAKLGLRQLQPAAAGAANILGLEPGAAATAPLAVPLAGGLAGVAGSAGFLAALQHDANRHVDIDYSKHTPDTAIARAFSNMRDSEKNRGRSLAERQDDPNDVMFTPDDTATVAADAPASDVSSVVQRFFGRR